MRSSPKLLAALTLVALFVAVVPAVAEDSASGNEESVSGNEDNVSGNEDSVSENSAAELVTEAARLAGSGDAENAVAKLRRAAEIETADAGLRFQLARMLAALGDLETAASVFAVLVEDQPENSAARLGEASVLLLRGRYLEARSRLEDGLRALPKDGQLAHMLARVLASAPVDEARDGQTALGLALKVWEVRKVWETGETVAMAMAEAGRFDDAVEFQRGLIEQAEAAGDEARLEGLRLRLLEYLSGEAWRAESAAEITNAAMPPGPPQSPPPSPGAG